MGVGEFAKAITEKIYRLYGTDSGCLFGLLPCDRAAVEAIVSIVLDLTKGEDADDKADD